MNQFSRTRQTFGTSLFPSLTDASFLKTTFGGSATFSGAEFPNGASFFLTRFEKEADFGVTEFGDSTYFDDAIFLGSAVFNGAIFSGSMFMKDVAFFSDADFSNTTFEGYTDCTGARVRGCFLGDFGDLIDLAKGEGILLNVEAQKELPAGWQLDPSDSDPRWGHLVPTGEISSTPEI
jgi:uncharacterized protein YjbI with pentapeptide repeats